MIRFAREGMYFGLSVPVSTPISDLEVVPLPVGGWVVYGVEAGDMGLGRIEAVRMDDQGLLELGPVLLSPPENEVVGFDVAPLGDGALALVLAGPVLDGSADLTVALAGASGVTATALLEGVNPLGKPRMVVNPAEGAILVAFESAAGGEASVRLARFGCAP